MTLLTTLRPPGAAPDNVAPTTNIISVSNPRMSRVTGKDTSVITWTADENFVQYEIRVTPATTSGVTEGTFLEGGSMVGSAGTQYQSTITDDELVAALAAEGTNILKVFVKDAAGNWTDSVGVAPPEDPPPPAASIIVRPDADIGIGASWWATPGPHWSRINESITQPSLSDTVYMADADTQLNETAIIGLANPPAGTTATILRLWVLAECVNGSLGSASLYVGGTQLGNASVTLSAAKGWTKLVVSGNFTNAQLNDLRIHLDASNVMSGEELRVYNAYVEINPPDAKPPLQLRPDADVAAAAWVTAPLWSKLNDNILKGATPPGTTIRTTSTGVGEVSFEDPPVGRSAGLGVMLHVYVNFDSTGTTQLNLKLLSNGVTLSTLSSTYGGWISIGTSEALTEDQLKNLRFQFSLSRYASTDTINIDTAYVEVVGE